MKKSIEFNTLQIPRYHMKLCHNEDGDYAWQLSEDLHENLMQLSYQEVIDLRKQDILAVDTVTSATAMQVFRNHLSSLNSFLASCGKTTESRVGAELTTNFDSRLKEYLSSLASLTPHTRNDRSSHLRAWHRHVTSLVEDRNRRTPRAALAPNVSAFHQALRSAVAASGESAKAIARHAGTCTSAMQRWLKGAYPNERSLPTVARLERYLGLPRDTLKELIPKTRAAMAQSQGEAARGAIPYRERHKQNTNSPYVIPDDGLSPQFLVEWHDFFEYKTVVNPELERGNRSTWRLLPREKVGAKLSPHAWRRNQGCPTADLTIRTCRAFFGFLSLPREHGGMGVPRDKAQSLAWFAVPKAVNGYFEFVRDRAGGNIHGKHRVTAAFIASLTTEKTGYLRQRPELAAALPENYRGVSWEKACTETRKRCNDWKKAATDISRNPEDPVRGLLSLSEPLLPILRAVDKLDEAAAKAPPGSLHEATLKRDALLLSMLVANPLRARNYVLMTYSEDQTGNLYRRQDGQWRIRFGYGDFKNDRRSGYDALLPRALAARIEEYVAEFRPRLLVKDANAPWVFPNSRSEKWWALNQQVERITRQYIPESHGFGPHALRHLVATDYLRKHPGDFLTVAELLHDTLDTVLRIYAHLKQDDSFGKYEEHLDAIKLH